MGLDRKILPLIAGVGVAIFYLSSSYEGPNNIGSIDSSQNEQCNNTNEIPQTQFCPFVYASWNNEPIHFYRFSTTVVDVGIQLEKRPVVTSALKEHLLRQYNDRLEFIADFGYFSLNDLQSVGRVVHNGKKRAQGTFEGGTCITHRQNTISIIPTLDDLANSYEWAHGGFPVLVRNHHPDLEETKKRNIDFFDKEERRLALTIYSESEAGFAFFTGPIDTFTDALVVNGVRDAALLDGGKSRYFGARKNGRFVDVKTSERKVKSFVYGVRRE